MYGHNAIVDTPWKNVSPICMQDLQIRVIPPPPRPLEDQPQENWFYNALKGRVDNATSSNVDQIVEI